MFVPTRSDCELRGGQLTIAGYAVRLLEGRLKFPTDIRFADIKPKIVSLRSGFGIDGLNARELGR